MGGLPGIFTRVQLSKFLRLLFNFYSESSGFSLYRLDLFGNGAGHCRQVTHHFFPKLFIYFSFFLDFGLFFLCFYSLCMFLFHFVLCTFCSRVRHFHPSQHSVPRQVRRNLTDRILAKKTRKPNISSKKQKTAANQISQERSKKSLNIVHCSTQCLDWVAQC